MRATKHSCWCPLSKQRDHHSSCHSSRLEAFEQQFERQSPLFCPSSRVFSRLGSSCFSLTRLIRLVTIDRLDTPARIFTDNLANGHKITNPPRKNLIMALVSHQPSSSSFRRRGDAAHPQLLEAAVTYFLFLVWCQAAHVLAGANGFSVICTAVGVTLHSVTMHLCRRCYQSWKESATSQSMQHDLPRRSKRPMIQMPVSTLCTRTLEHKQVSLLAQGHRCPICLERLGHEQEVCVGPSCGHIFHNECIHTWMKYSTTACPCCRQDMWGG